MKRPKTFTVAQYLTVQIELSGKTQIEIARECGFSTPNIVTIIKQGKARLPLARVTAMAAALGVDPVRLFSMVMKEYEPRVWETFQACLDQPVLTANEIELIEVIRAGSKVQNPKLRTAQDKKKLLAVIDQLPGDESRHETHKNHAQKWFIA